MAPPIQSCRRRYSGGPRFANRRCAYIVSERYPLDSSTSPRCKFNKPSDHSSPRSLKDSVAYQFRAVLWLDGPRVRSSLNSVTQARLAIHPLSVFTPEQACRSARLHGYLNWKSFGSRHLAGTISTKKHLPHAMPPESSSELLSNRRCSRRRSYGTRRGTRCARVHGAILWVRRS